jgi:hypothetical protein
VIHWVSLLPYGRNSDRSSFIKILSERRGTCSTKHAFIARLAEEQNIEIDLYVGIYGMNQTNTPFLEDTLHRFGLVCLPEAHCYLGFDGFRFDLTFSNQPQLMSLNILTEMKILPHEIGEFKLSFHKDFIKQWIAKEKIDLSFDALWSIREMCISRIEKNSRV